MDEDRIIAEVARRNGVLLAPNDPIMQINTMLELHAADQQEREAKLADVPAETELRIAPLLAEVRALMAETRTLTVEAQRAADKPLMTDQQVKWTVLPALLAAWDIWHVLVLVAAVAVGFGIHWWMTPTLNCAAELGGRTICYRFDGPPPPAPQTQPIQRGKP
jgi:hypothetical protein